MDDMQAYNFQPLELTNESSPYPDMDYALGYGGGLQLEPGTPYQSTNHDEAVPSLAYEPGLDWDNPLSMPDSTLGLQQQIPPDTVALRDLELLPFDLRTNLPATSRVQAFDRGELTDETFPITLQPSLQPDVGLTG